jgi:hypothetical protein
LEADGVGVAVDNGMNTVYKQAFTIPYGRFQSKELARLTLQRGGAEQSYWSSVYLMAIRISYSAVR